jgi:hypothetical protein
MNSLIRILIIAELNPTPKGCKTELFSLQLNLNKDLLTSIKD